MSIKPYIVEFERRLLAIAYKNVSIYRAEIQRKKGIIQELQEMDNEQAQELARKYEKELIELKNKLSEWQVIIDEINQYEYIHQRAS